jgi:LmeA-like phospholipid-binding
VKKAAIVLLVLIGLLVAIDFGTAAAAEYQVSKRLRTHLGLPDDPAVRINGFPFLTQAIAGDYRSVEVTADRVTVARLRDIGVEATLQHVRVPLSELLSGSADSARVDQIVGRARIRVAELGKMIDVENLRIEQVTDDTQTTAPPQDGSGTGTVRLIGNAEVLGERTEVAIVGSLELVGGQIQVTAHDVEIAGNAASDALPAQVKQQLLRGFSARLDPGALPFEITPTGIRLEDDTLIVEGNVRDIQLSPSGVS